MKKKILYLAFRFPWPQTDGYKLRVYNYCKLIKKLGHEIDLLFIYETEIEYQNYMEEAKKIFDNIYPVKLTKGQKILNLLKSLILGQSLQENIYITSQGNKKIEELRENYDLYISSYIRMFKYVLNVDKSKRVIDFTDSISYHYDEARKISKGLWNIIHKYEFLKVKKFEHFVLDNSEKRMITSPLDKEYILKDYSGKNKEVEIFPQAVSEELIIRAETYKKQEKESEKKKLVFLGKMNYYPNEDAVIHFCKNILPSLKNVELKIVGTSPSKEVLKLQEEFENVIVTGFVEDPYAIILESDIMIAPMRLGGGIQNKILEGMALGKTVISYKERIKPIIKLTGKENKNYILGVVSDEEIINLINNITLETFDEIGLNAKNFIKENYLWNSIKNKLKIILE